MLVKPKPSNPEVVAERREIALMAHDMKLFLQMVRRISYQRVVGRVVAEQSGWLAGFGATDPALTLAILTKQAARLHKPIYLLYIDLATFFPRCDRRVITIAEALHGLPRQVRELSLQIFGTADQPEKAVECFYDSAGGLGAGFRNHMGALMGCVLSPDKAKLLLNSVLVAIKAVCKGVRLWGQDMWREVTQVAYADDWCGCFSSAGELKKAWAIWRCWEAISGSKLGVKEKLKTVVTGVRWLEDKQVSITDPGLAMRDGSKVPFMACDEAYKHLGNWRRADGKDDIGWARLKRKLQAALAKLRRMWRPSVNEFLIVSNALLGGLAGYYLKTLYVSFEQAEEVEREWRCIYRSKFGRSFEEMRSKPRAYYYQDRGKGAVRRVHIWAEGLSAVATCMNEAVADVHDTPQRAAARSEIALALERWGCCSEPNQWKWGHLRESLEAQLKRSPCKHLGEAWMLAKCLLEGAQEQMWNETQEQQSKWARDFGKEQREAWGRWRGEIPPGDPLHRDAAH